MNQGVPLSKMSCDSGKCICYSCGATAQQPEKGFVLHWCKARKRGLGDMVAAGLSAVGITKERFSKFLGAPCACQERQEALNKLGIRLGIGRQG